MESWLLLIPVILTGTIFFIFYPVLSKKGYQKLPQGIESSTESLLETEKNLLLIQLKELEYSPPACSEEEQESRNQTKQDLEKKLTKLLNKQSTPNEQKTAHQPNNRDRATAIITIAMVVVLSMGSYFIYGRPFQKVIDQAVGTQQQDMLARVRSLAERLKNEPKNLDGWFQLARSYTVLNLEKDAIKAYRHIHQQFPKNLDAQVGLANLLVESGKKEQFVEGLKLFKAILETDPNRPEALMFLGIIAYRTGDFNSAKSYWENLLSQLDQHHPMRPNLEEALADIAKKAQEPTQPKTD
ncbi:c-type cytochrome biogenesis protein CcmI [Magnetococcales bacterium HHB-1]